MKRIIKIILFSLLGLMLLLMGIAYSAFFSGKKEFNVLVFSKTAGYRHSSIPIAQQAIMVLGKKHGFKVDTTENAAVFQEKNLQKYKVIIFLSTTGDVLNDAQQIEMNRFIQAGGGFVGIHSAADTEYDWPWYGALVGAYFESHPNDPNVREAVLQVVDQTHEASKHLAERWTRTDEWYNYKNISPHLQVLIELDESTYQGGTNGAYHPISWYQEFDGGRSFYTGLGHTEETYTEPAFLKHLWGGISYAAADGQAVDYDKSTVAPEENRFNKVVLDEGLNEPMELDILPNGKILFIERPGNLQIFDPQADSTRLVSKLPVFQGLEDGLLGLAIDPNYADNNWIYLFYSPIGAEAKQHISRFVFDQDAESLDMASEKLILTIKTQRAQCCHSAGALEFGPNGHLFIATGDNTSPRATGYAPVDERAGRAAWDAQKSAANSHDLRGKILRISPQADGSYRIPAGNLFPADGSAGRPEIYVMGCRNPYRIAIDSHTGYLYWGDVGPDAGEDSIGLGPRGYDEINQARSAGYFGWPYFVGNNEAYYHYDFTNKTTRKNPHDPLSPSNHSPNNTGINELPPAQPAFIWYAYGTSKKFPLLKDGSRNAMAGPVFYAANYPESEQRFPVYYNGKFLAYDWMRGWIMAISMAENGDFERMEPFLPNMKLNNPIDMLFAPDGSLYLLEYGTRWFAQNADARLVHIAYIAGNRKPLARIAASQQMGAVPLTVNFEGSKSVDFDGDSLKYAWSFEGDQHQSTEINPSFTFEKTGTYRVQLSVTDPAGESAEAQIDILVGNDLPQLNWDISGNETFYWDNQSFGYEVKVSDTEDGSLADGGISPDQVRLSIDYLERGHDLTHIAQGHQALLEASDALLGKTLIDHSDCKACHQLNSPSVGPSYRDISQKYKDDPKASPYLVEKVIKGGAGVWGEIVMAAHPQLSPSEAEQMVKYILSLENTSLATTLPLSGTYTPTAHIGQGEEGTYVLTAAYTDKGGPSIGPLTAQQTLVLRHPRIMATDCDELFKAMIFEVTPEMAGNFIKIEESFELLIGSGGNWIKFSQIDLTGIESIDMLGGALSAFMDGGFVEVRIDEPEGEKIGSLEIESTLTPAGMQETHKAHLRPTEGKHDVYLYFDNRAGESRGVMALVWVYFVNGE